MKFSINSKILQSKLAAAFKAVPQRSPLQVLNNFLLRVSEDSLHITAYDTENMVSVSTAATVEKEGLVCVDAKFLMNLIKNTANVPVAFSVSDTSVLMSTPSAKYRTAAVDPLSFPSPEPMEECSAEFSVSAQRLSNALQSVSFAVGTDDFQPQLMGVCVDCSSEGIRVYATDTRRMGRYIISGEYPQCRFILPAKTVQMLSAVAEGDITVRVSARSVEFSAEGFMMRSQLLVGRFPDCERVMPKEYSVLATVDRQSLVGALRRASLCSADSSSMVKLTFGNETLEVRTQDVTLEREAHENVPCSCSAPVTIGFSSDFLLSVLSSLDCESLRIEMNTAARPAVFRSSDDAEGTLTLLCMPVNFV